MSKSTLQARRYSQAIFEIALENNTFEEWKNDLDKVAILAREPEFVSVMENPKYSIDLKVSILDAQIRGVSKLAQNLAHILVSRGQFSLIIEIIAQYQQLLDNYYGVAKAEVITAVHLDETESQKLQKWLAEITGKEIILIEVVDPTIIGGVIARVDGKIIDGSTRSQLTALKNELALIS